jgi:hypothetical protein
VLHVREVAAGFGIGRGGVPEANLMTRPSRPATLSCDG